MNNYNNINNIATIIPQFNMAFTRKQAKQQQQQEQQEKRLCVQKHSHQIDFIDASIEWRKNKIKRENCTFEYI